MQTIANTRAESQHLRSRGIGSGIGTLIGAGWMVFGLAAFHDLVRVLLGAIGLIVVGFLLNRSRRLVVASHRLPSPDEAARSANRHIWRWFWLNFLLEIVLLNVAINLLIAPPLRIYWIPAISLVVGLHFFPMARFFEVPSYWVCGGAMIGGAAMTAVALRLGGRPTIVVGIEAVANAFILWGTAAWAGRLLPAEPGAH